MKILLFIFCLMSGITVLAQQKPTHILEFDYSRRVEDKSVLYVKITDSVSPSESSGIITDSLIENISAYNAYTFLYSFKVADNVYFGGFLEQDNSLGGMVYGLHSKINASQILLKNKLARFDVYVNMGNAFSYYSKKKNMINKKSTFVLQNYSIGLELGLRVTQHITANIELARILDPWQGVIHPWFFQYGISYTWNTNIQKNE